MPTKSSQKYRGYTIRKHGDRWMVLPPKDSWGQGAWTVATVTEAKRTIDDNERPNPATTGRKVKGGRAITVKNFTGTITRMNSGAVVIRGRKK